MDRLLNVMTVLSVGLLLAVLFSVRRSHIRVEYSVSWLTAGVILLILSRWQGLLERLSAFLGAGSGPIALLMLVLCVFLVVFYRFSMIISNLKDANIAMAQRLAVLEYHLRNSDEKQQSEASAR